MVIAPLFSTEEELEIAFCAVKANVPSETFVAPVKLLFAALSVNVPSPVLSIAPEPEIALESVRFLFAPTLKVPSAFR